VSYRQLELVIVWVCVAVFLAGFWYGMVLLARMVL
jgi:hypothetical protein